MLEYQLSLFTFQVVLTKALVSMTVCRQLRSEFGLEYLGLVGYVVGDGLGLDLGSHAVLPTGLLLCYAQDTTSCPIYATQASTTLSWAGLLLC